MAVRAAPWFWIPEQRGGAEMADLEVKLDESGLAIVAEEQTLLDGLRKALAAYVPVWKDPRYDEDLLTLRDSLGEAREDELAQIVAQMDSLASLSAHQQRKAPVAALPDLDSPYFGHLRVKQGGRVRDILIGNRTLTSSDLPYPIIDWRHAPISRIFFCYQEGDEYEEEFGGRTVEGEVLALRRVLVVKGRLIRVDCPQGAFQLRGEAWSRMERPRPRMQGGSGSALRPGMIGPPRLGIEAGKSSPVAVGSGNRHLPVITGLMDADQFQLITRPDSGVIVIDGGAGSGKTTIALHRIAYLCHLNPERFRPDQILVVVFNKALSSYISQILPALGVNGVRIVVLDELFEQLRRRHYPRLVVEYSDTTPTSVIRLKQHPATWAYLLERVAVRTAEIERDLVHALANAPGAEDALAAWRSLALEPLGVRLERFAAWVRGTAILPGIGAAPRDWLARQRVQPVLEELLSTADALPGLATSIWEEAFLQLDPLQESMQRLAPGEFSSGDLETVRNWALRFYSEREDARAEQESGSSDGDDGDDEPGGEHSAHRTPQLDREDDTLLLLLHIATVGPLRSSKKRPISVAHLTVDEAQDFSTLELRVLLGLAAEPRSVTLAGDTDQRMILHNHFTQWDTVLDQLGLERTAISPLKVGYRSTAEIMRFATQVLGPLHTDRPWVPTREGVPVELLRFAHPGQAVAVLAESLRLLIRSEPEANVALVARHPAQADLYYEGLAKSEIPRLTRVSEQNFSFQPGIEVTDITQVKGLEYDYVVLLDVDQATYPDDPQSRYLLHIGATRAAHQLWLVACRTPSPLLPAELTQHMM
jgi:DNA helicase-2/ATP-dependent DNA helicase PcrA